MDDSAKLQAEIAETRERLGETVEALSYKTDVSARASDAVSAAGVVVESKVLDVRDAISEAATDLRVRPSSRVPLIVAAVIAVVAALLVYRSKKASD